MMCDVSRSVVHLVAVSLTCVLSVLWSACVGTPSAPTQFAPFSQTDLRVGTGAVVADRDILNVSYTGWLYDETASGSKGPVFDATAPGATLQFMLGTGDVIRGWDQGLVGMRVGGVRRLVIPPSLGYGGTREGILPANATLIFEIELVRIGADAPPS
jgi:FKBP-type peptidyl-prolyl cis-trans isomerase FkpA